MSNQILNHFLMPITRRPEVIMVKGEGSYLWDNNGRRYLDFIQGWAVNSLGHCPEVVRRAIVEQSARLLTPSPALYNEPELELAELLSRASGLAQVFFCNCGTEANESAIKLARKWGRLHRNDAYEIITAQNAFHGRTLASMAASGKPGWESLFPPPMPGFIKVPFGNAEVVESVITAKTVAVMIEPIQGEAGVVIPPDGYLQRLRQITKRHDLLLIVDEIQTGMGRTGAAFCHQFEGIQADIMTLGKGLGGGVPIAAMLASEKASCFSYGEQGGTYNGNPLMTAVALAVSRVVLQPDFIARVGSTGRYLLERLKQLANRHECPEIRGRGLLAALRLPGEYAEEVRDRCFEHGLLINAPRPNLLRFMPALNVTIQEVDKLIEIVEESLNDLARFKGPIALSQK
ncbi:MAG: aminotransferase class III-fold pyridoxal phosphate-dependent enzyme [Deltaproteobacteria bacterium]|nr:aminotransferase class III-fold pyridoxal phosphate-dependent enzyme [Deltaproteobacteria bacterium]